MRSACPVGCGRTVGPGKLLCLPCWRQVPADIQRRVYRTWRAVCNTPTDENEAAYDEAREAAIASVS